MTRLPSGLRTLTTGGNSLRNHSLLRPIAIGGIVGLTVLGVISTATQSAADLTVMSGVSLTTLPNGLRILVREQHGAPLVALDLWVRAGSGQEAQGESGCAHFLEHMLFKGTSELKRGDVDAKFEDMGASLEAGTLRDGAHYYSTVASRFLLQALTTLADAVEHPALKADELERERKVILDEVALSENDLPDRAEAEMRQALYPDRPYDRQIRGEKASIATQSTQSVTGFYQRCYGPSNATLVLVGDITVPQANTMATAAFAGWVAATNRQSSLPAPLAGPLNPIRVLGMEPHTAAIAFRVPAADSPTDACIADLITEILGSRRTGRLNSALDLLETEPVTADYVNTGADGVMAYIANVHAGRESATVTAMRAAVAQLRTDPIDPDDLEYARRRLMGRYLYDIETYSGQARALGMHDILGDFTFAQHYPDLLRAITPAQVKSFAVRWLQPDGSVELVSSSEANQ